MKSVTKPISPTVQADEVRWYRQYGKYPKHRIGRDKSRQEYVIGDESWNRHNPHHREFIELAMSQGISP